MITFVNKLPFFEKNKNKEKEKLVKLAVGGVLNKKVQTKNKNSE